MKNVSLNFISPTYFKWNWKKNKNAMCHQYFCWVFCAFNRLLFVAKARPAIFQKIETAEEHAQHLLLLSKQLPTMDSKSEWKSAPSSMIH
uniref:Uncharacterized protein n=1 Tax=Ditylenchus dipsaci TaxID=166011 RepID=A0A915CPG0_9BILA